MAQCSFRYPSERGDYSAGRFVGSVSTYSVVFWAAIRKPTGQPNPVNPSDISLREPYFATDSSPSVGVSQQDQRENSVDAAVAGT